MTDFDGALASITVDEDGVSWIDPGADPAATDVVLGALVDEVGAESVDAVVAWSSPTNAMLCIAAARLLAVPAVLILEDEGLLTLGRSMAPARMLAVASQDEPGRAASVVASMLAVHGHELVASAVLAPSGSAEAGIRISR